MIKNYKHTIYASYIGYITQAIINNFAPLLFLTFQKQYNISLNEIALLVTINFGVQLVVDALSAKFVDKIGYKISIVSAHIIAAVGLISLCILPSLLPNAYIGLIIAVAIYAIGGGLIEVLVSPIVEACPTEEKSSSMSLLHSFYCWGHVLVVLGSSLFFYIFGIDNWRVLTCVWAIVPIVNAVYYSLVPINKLVEDENEGLSLKNLCSMKLFWIIILLMVCAGASEQAMSQWASAFAEEGLHVSKTIGDLAGPCFFAIMMGTSRVLYAKYSNKIDLNKFITLSSLLCVLSYLIAVFAPLSFISLVGCGLCGLSVGILWPGVFSIAAEKFPKGGTLMFALMALAGDLGCSAGPSVVGVISESAGDNLKMGLLFAIIFPISMICGVVYLKKHINVRKNNSEEVV